MSAISNTPDSSNERVQPKTYNWIATFVALCVIGGIVWFVARIFFFTHLLSTGQFDAESFNFSQKVTSISKLASTAPQEGTFDLVTATNPSLGTPNAPMTIVEFADFGCPYSQEASFALRAFAAAHPQSVHYVYRDFPLTELHPTAARAAQAARCAHEQQKFWEYHDKLYQNQTEFTDALLQRFAREINVNTDQFANCLASNKYAQAVSEDYQAGFDAGVRGTPTFFLNGYRVPGAMSQEALEKILASIVQTP